MTSAQVFKPTRWTLLFLLLSAMMILMGGAAVAPALPLISAEFPDASDATISLIITLPALAIALTGIFIGVLSDRIGRIPVLAGSVAVFTLAGSSGYYLTSLPLLLAGRFILGMGIAGIICTTSALVISYYHGVTRTKILGYQAAAMGFGVLVLETSGGFLAGFSWHTAFLIYLLGIVILAGVLLTMREPAAPKLEEIAGAPDEKFPFSSLMLVYITIFLGNMLFFLLPTKFPYLIAGMDAVRIFGENTALASGIFLGISGLASTLIGLFYGRFAWRLHRYSLLMISMLCFAVGLCSLGLATSLVIVAFGVICVGIGEGMLMPTILNWIASITPRQFLGRASGGFSVALNLGNFAISLAMVPVIAIVATCSNLFLAFGCVAFVLSLPYLVATLKLKYGIPQKVPLPADSGTR